MNVSQNIIYGLKVRKVAKAAQQAALKRVVDLMDLSSILARKPAF